MELLIITLFFMSMVALVLVGMGSLVYVMANFVLPLFDLVYPLTLLQSVGIVIALAFINILMFGVKIERT